MPLIYIYRYRFLILFADENASLQKEVNKVVFSLNVDSSSGTDV